MDVFARCVEDRFTSRCDGDERAPGAVPRELNVGFGDCLQFSLCASCGQMQSRWPLPPHALLTPKGDFEADFSDDEPDPPLRDDSLETALPSLRVCLRCSSRRFLEAAAEMIAFAVMLEEQRFETAAPSRFGLGTLDAVQLAICADCGHLAGRWPFVLEGGERAEIKDENQSGEFDDCLGASAESSSEERMGEDDIYERVD